MPFLLTTRLRLQRALWPTPFQKELKECARWYMELAMSNTNISSRSVGLLVYELLKPWSSRPVTLKLTTQSFTSEVRVTKSARFLYQLKLSESWLPPYSKDDEKIVSLALATVAPDWRLLP